MGGIRHSISFAVIQLLLRVLFLSEVVDTIKVSTFSLLFFSLWGNYSLLRLFFLNIS